MLDLTPQPLANLISKAAFGIIPGCVGKHLPVEIESKENIRTNLNVLILNAAGDDVAHERLARALTDLLPNAQVDYLQDWQGKRVNRVTRIYYLGTKNRDQGRLLQDRMGGSVEIYDYDGQHENGRDLKDKPNGQVTRIKDINPKRDLLIFVGLDQTSVMERLKTFE